MQPVTGNTYPHRAALRQMGGKWDSSRRAWMMPDEKWEEANNLVNPGSMVQSSSESSSLTGERALWEEGEGYGGSLLTVGQVYKRPSSIHLKTDWVTVVRSWSKYFAEDGMSFGVGAEDGHVFYAVVRASTPEECAPNNAVVAEFHAAEARWLRAQEEIESSCDQIAKGERPQCDHWPEGVRMTGARRRETFVIGDEYIWSILHNGNDGDDWSYNNLPGGIGVRIPKDPELVKKLQVFDEIRAEYLRARAAFKAL